LVGKRSVAAIRKSLQAINTGTEAYDAAYSTVMERIGSQAIDQVELAHDVLAWIVHARRRLTIMELQQALGVEIGEPEFDSDNCPDIDYIVSVCAGLVTIDHGTNVIRLAHYTAQEYLEKNQLKWLPDAEAKIANVCTTYLSFIASRATLVPQPEHQVVPAASGFYNYAALNWGHHARVAPTTLAETMRLLRQPSYVEIAWPTISWSLELALGLQHSTKGTGLHLAAYFGIETAASKLIYGSASPEREVSRNITPIMLAALRGHESIVKLLLDHKVDVTPNLSKLTPLYLAARGGHKMIVQRLLEYRPTIEEDLGSYEPLYGASTNGHDHVVRILLEHFSRTPMSTIQYLRVLSYAMAHNYDAIIDDLLSTKDPPNFANMGPRSKLLVQATERNNLRIVQFLLDNNMPAYNYKPPLLHVAASLGRVAIGGALLQAGADITSLNDRYQDALHIALEGGQVAFVKMMLDYCVNMQQYTERGIANTNYLKSIDNKSLLFTMVSKERKVPVQTLLEAGADPNYVHTSGQSPLHAACLHHSFGYTTIPQLLLNAGAEVDKRDYFGRTPLHIACMYRSYGCEKMVKCMLDAGADINAQDHFGKSALHMACTNEHENLVRLLLDNGAKVHCADIYGNSPLHIACRWDDEAIAKLLLEAGAVIKCQNKVGDSPLHYACWVGSEAVVNLLLKAGADMWCTNSGGESPFDNSRSQGHKAIMRLLLGHGPQKYQLPWTIHHSWPTDPQWPTDPPWPTHALELTHKIALRLQPDL
jgi:ankyrin repeat protein